MMSSNVSPIRGGKRQRIMIITTDESVIDQIEKSNNISSLIEMAIPPKGNNSEKSAKQVSVRLF